MRILLVGEYSGFHNALKKGLLEYGHEVTIVGNGDGFKQFPVDIFVGHKAGKEHFLLKKLRVLFWKITGYDWNDRSVLVRFRESEHLLKNYDLVQFINSNPFNCQPAVERKMLSFLIAQTKHAFLVACGDDVPYASYLVHTHQGYSVLKPEATKLMPEKYIINTLKYLKKGYIDNYNYLLNHCKYIVPSNTDFVAPLKKEPKATRIIPAPVQVDALPLYQNTDLSVIYIFMGINKSNYWKKGINYFEAALQIIEKKYGNRVVVTRAMDLPYKTYINAYKNCHILLDQVLCYDQGYNALEAMAQGKVVFAGGSEAYLAAHGLQEIPVIDAQPDVNYLVNQLEKLIENPQELITLGLKARDHVLHYHDYKNIAKQYLDLYHS